MAGQDCAQAEAQHRRHVDQITRRRLAEVPCRGGSAEHQRRPPGGLSQLCGPGRQQAGRGDEQV